MLKSWINDGITCWSSNDGPNSCLKLGAYALSASEFVARALDSMFTQFLQTACTSWIAQSDDEPVQLKLKLLCGSKLEIRIPPSKSLEYIAEVWDCAAPWFDRNSQIRFVSAGKTQCRSQTIGSLAKRTKCVVHLVLPLHGGGAKSEHVLAVKAELAKLCINSGIPLQQVNPFVEQIFNQAGLQKVQHVLLGKQDQWCEIQQLCKDVSVPVPVIPNREVSAAKASSRKGRCD